LTTHLLPNSKGPLADKFRKIRVIYVVVGVISCAVNLLMLTGPLFMLQVYDRVLTSQSIPTLIALLGLVIGLYMIMGVLDFLRVRTLSRLSHWLDNGLSPLAFRSWVVRSLSSNAPGYRPIQDLATVRGFMGSPTILALFDLPWFPLYLAVVFFLHVYLGLLATFGALVVVVFALLNERLTSKAVGQAAQADVIESRFADQAHKGAESVLSMGMLGNATHAWSERRNQALYYLQKGSERSEMFTASSKSFRMLLQSSILALGGYLAIQQEISPGMIVAASIIAGRALAPIDQTISGWRLIKRARLARGRLEEYLDRDSQAVPAGVKLPAPHGNIEVRNVVKNSFVKDPAADALYILSDLNFELKPGDGLGVIGPSASGKSSLARLLVGLWMPDRGSVRIDGATFEQWDPDDIGPYIGYLPQEVALLSGTVAQNIARFDGAAAHEDIVEAAQIAGVHDIILRLPEGYATNVDDALSPLTGGQKQRIALARAIYKQPVLIVLDEPNSNLDAEGDIALSNAIEEMRNKGSVVVVMAHRPSAIASVDQVLMLNNGKMVEFGPKADVLRKVTRVA